MEDLETRKARRIEQMVAKWLRRSRDHAARGRASVGDRTSDSVNQHPTRVKLTVEVQKDVLLGHYGFEVSQHLPLLITSVATGSTADGKLLPGDHIIAINNKAAEEDVTGEQAAALLRESEDTLQFTVLRCTSVNCLHVPPGFEMLLGGVRANAKEVLLLKVLFVKFPEASGELLQERTLVKMDA
uniref:FERM and PDZ domain-containing protein 1 n=1 Tax=Podarcis muralis TaxID=64176 RepID=UPI0010A05FBD|nr:FERM and PDZ domain-containing protein 1 [Podarcis muralis]